VTAALSDPLEWAARPRRFAIALCVMPSGDAPCTHTHCRYHLAHLTLGDHRRDRTRDCALAVASEGPRTLDEVAEILGLTGERVRQIEEHALTKLRNSAALQRLFDETDD
jgi:hypothetical protein